MGAVGECCGRVLGGRGFRGVKLPVAPGVTLRNKRGLTVVWSELVLSDLEMIDEKYFLGKRKLFLLFHFYFLIFTRRGL